MTSESLASRTSLLGHPFMASRKLLKIRPNRVRQNSISDSEEKKEVGAKMEPVDGDDGDDDGDGDEKKQEIERMKEITVKSSEKSVSQDNKEDVKIIETFEMKNEAATKATESILTDEKESEEILEDVPEEEEEIIVTPDREFSGGVRDHSQPMRGQDPGHVIILDQSEVIDSVQSDRDDGEAADEGAESIHVENTELSLVSSQNTEPLLVDGAESSDVDTQLSGDTDQGPKSLIESPESGGKLAAGDQEDSLRPTVRCRGVLCNKSSDY